jgi:hypothetical protein
MANETKNTKRKNNIVSKTAKINLESLQRKQSRSVKLAKKEIQTTKDYAEIMAALMLDVIEGKVSVSTVNAAVNSGRQLIRVAELNLKYGGKKDKHTIKETKTTTLNLLTGE